MGYLKFIGTVVIYIGLFLAIITFLPGLPPEADYSEYSIKPPSKELIESKLRKGLHGAEVLFSGELVGPEAFASYNGELYAGVRGGYVVKIEENRITPVVKFGQKCAGLWEEERCGRPLGLRFNNKGELFVADAYYGIFKVNVNTRQYVNIINSSVPINGKTPKMVIDLEIAKNGDIYWSYASSDFYLHDGIYACLANPSGRLLRYNALTKKNEVLVDNLGFANGVALSDDESFVIVIETLTSRIIKYNLKGPKAGQREVFAEGLPGLPDNVHSDGNGGFLLSLILYTDAEHPNLAQSLMPHPHIRKMLSRLMYLIEAPFKLLESVYPNYYAKKVLHSVGTMDLSQIFDVKKTSVVLRMDKVGNILEAIYSDDGKVHNICSAYVHKEYLWLGSPWNEYVMRVPLKQAFPSLAAKLKPSTHTKPKQEEPLLTVSGTPNIKVEQQRANVKPANDGVKPTNQGVKPVAQNVKPAGQSTKPAGHDTKPAAQGTAPPVKSTVQPQTTQKPTTSQPTTTTTTTTATTATPKPTTTPPPTKAPAKEVRKDSIREAKKDNTKEIKKDNSNANTKPQATKKNNQETVKPKSDDTIKKDAREA